MQAETMHAGPMVGIAGAMEMEGKVPSNNAFEPKWHCASLSRSGASPSSGGRLPRHSGGGRPLNSIVEGTK